MRIWLPPAVPGAPAARMQARYQPRIQLMTEPTRCGHTQSRSMP